MPEKTYISSSPVFFSFCSQGPGFHGNANKLHWLLRPHSIEFILVLRSRVRFLPFQAIHVWRRDDGEGGQEGWQTPALSSLEFSQPAKPTKTTPLHPLLSLPVNTLPLDSHVHLEFQTEF